MSNSITPNDVAKMMAGVSEMEFKLYPNTYDTDARIAKILHLGGSRNMYISEIFAHIDNYYGGVAKWFDLFKKRFGDSVSIEEHYDELTDNFSSPEIIAYYDIYPNLSYYSFRVMDEKDDRDCRETNKTVMRLPDTSIKSMYINLRNLFQQDVVDKMNKYFIAKNMLVDNAMFKRPAVVTVEVAALFDIFGEFAAQYKDDEFADVVYSGISLIDIDELARTRVTLLTDYPNI